MQQNIAKIANDSYRQCRNKYSKGNFKINSLINPINIKIFNTLIIHPFYSKQVRICINYLFAIMYAKLNISMNDLFSTLYMGW